MPLTSDAVLVAARRLVEAFARTDTAAYFACFHPRATFLFHTEPALLESRAAYERLWASWIGEGWQVVSCASSDPHVVVVGETAVFSHRVHTVTRVGSETTSTVERESIVFAAQGDSVVAVHEHLSPA
ncbi:MAG: nuclear transport factor 2 family protein [Nocardioides sp.]|uniref:YybH family protein n=1 Tax=Nocardioides sp. TaxID=35761 RepID=UPI0039E5BED7